MSYWILFIMIGDLSTCTKFKTLESLDSIETCPRYDTLEKCKLDLTMEDKNIGKITHAIGCLKVDKK